jgi:hypothetical protein
VSKLCCPACQEFLAVLDGVAKEYFFVRGHHSTPSLSELPAWLPESIVLAMVNRFRIRLINELNTFLNWSNEIASGVRVPQTRSRNVSGQSDGCVSVTSSDSNASCSRDMDWLKVGNQLQS